MDPTDLNVMSYNINFEQQISQIQISFYCVCLSIELRDEIPPLPQVTR